MILLLLSDEKFIQITKTNLEVFKDKLKEFLDMKFAQDWIKYDVRLFLMRYSKELALKENLQKKLQAAQLNTTSTKPLRGILNDPGWE